MSITHYMITESSSPPLPGDSEWIPVAAPSSSISVSGSFTLSSGNGAKTVYAWVKDDANNVSVVNGDSHFNITLDKTAPGFTLSKSPDGWTKDNVSITASSITFSISGKKHFRWAKGEYTVDNFPVGSGSTDLVIIDGSSTFTVEENAAFTVYAESLAGNKTVHTIASKIDKFTPEIVLSAPPAWTRENVTVTADTTVGLSGIDKKKYAQGHRDAAYFTTAGETITGYTFDVSSNGEYTAYLSNTANNSAVTYINITQIDKTAPTIALSAPSTWTKVDVTITATITDTQSGVAVKKWAPGKHVADYFATGSTTFVGTDFAVSADDWYTVYAKDNAGNTAVDYINISDIDTIAPVSSSVAAISCNGNVEAFWISGDGVRNIRKTPDDSWSMKNLGGNAIKIAAARNNDGTLELFAIGVDNKYYTNRQSEVYGDSWNGWVNRGDSDLGMNDISVSRNSDGRLEVFGIDSKVTYFLGHELYHQWQNEVNNDNSWSGWSKLASNNLRWVSSAINSDGRLEVFFNVDVVCHVWQQNPHAGPWSNKSNLDSNSRFSNISAVCNSDGRLEVFGINSQNKLFNIWQKKPHSGPWSDWNNKICGKGAVKQISVTSNSDGRLEVFGIGLDDCLYHIYQSKPSSGPWTDWEKLGTQKVKAISAARNFRGCLEVFAIGFDNNIYHMKQTMPNSGPWSPWEQIYSITSTVGIGMTGTDKHGNIKQVKVKAAKRAAVKKTITKIKPEKTVKAKPVVKKQTKAKPVEQDASKKAAALKKIVKTKATSKKASVKKIKPSAVTKKALKKAVKKKFPVKKKSGISKTKAAVKKSKPVIKKKTVKKKSNKK